MSETPEQQAAETTEATGGETLLEQVMRETKITPTDEWYAPARDGMAAFFADLVKTAKPGEKVHPSRIDKMIADIDAKLTAQLNQILHAPTFQRLESSWRSLKFLIDRTDFRENNKIELLNVAKSELADDFDDAPEMTKSGLYKHVYVAEYGQHGGEPVASIIANYEFDASSPDMHLLEQLASVASMAHAPMIASVSPTMFDIKDWGELAGLKDLASVFEGPKYIKWAAFRESEDARYVGLAMPRFMLRAPYHPENNPVRAFNYEENAAASSGNYLWGSAAFALATRLSESFAKYRWAPNIIGPRGGGAVEDLPLHNYESMGQLTSKPPIDVMISDRREFELAEQGFIPLTLRKNSDNAAFFSANSTQKPKVFADTEEGRTAQANYKLSTQLPSMFIINRLAHYIKVLQRENLGTWKSRPELEEELNNWIRAYVSDQENPSAEVRSRRPLRKARIEVEEVEGEVGWYRARISVQPHFKYMGADFTLSLSSRLETT